MKGKQRSLNGLFWRYLLSTMALLAGVLLALWFVLLQLIRMGAVLPADTGARNLERTTVLLQAQETFDPGEIPFYYRWALADSSGILESNLSPKEETWAQKVLAGEVSRHGFLYTKYYWSVPLSGGRVCLLQYDYAVCYANPTLQERLPDFQLLFFLVCLGCLVLVALWRTHHYTKGLRRDAQAITLACNGVAQQTLDTPFPAQAQVRELQAALTALDTLRRELAASLQDQWAGEQQKQALLAALAHDLKTPLTIISGNAELLDEDNLPPAQQACVQAILRGARSAEDYVTHLQAITTGLPPAASAQTVSGADLAQACAALGRDLTAPKGITFSWQTDPHPLPDRALSLDRTAFLRAAENLLSNGVRYTPAGQTLDCGLRLTAQRLFLWVQDSGPGFSPEALAKAGKLFYTEEPSRPQGGHLGMGLYSAAQTARAHGGGLCLENTSRGGRATLWISIS